MISTAVSCFFKLSRAPHADSRIDTLVAVLGEWEGLFTAKHDEEASMEASDAGNAWNSDDWDAGWESFQDIEPREKENTGFPALRPLHVCRLEIFKKLVTLSRFRDVLRLVDQSNGIFLDEDGARSLTEVVLQMNCLMAVKLVLLLPYEPLRLQFLAAVEDKLRQGGFSDSVARDHDFLILLSSSGLVSSIISHSSYGTTFSYICYLVGSISHQFQAAQLSRLVHEGSHESDRDSLLFRRIVFPYLVSELVNADQQLLAGLIVTKFMHTNACLSLVNISVSSLERFLERQLHLLQRDKVALFEAVSHETLKNTTSSLVDKLATVVQSAFSVLLNNVR